MSLDISSRWNIVDQIFFTVENMIKTVYEELHDSSSAEPDVELMVAAETEYLQRENEKLKKREIPVYLIEEENKVLCPKCREQLQSADVKYCWNCGHRVIRHMSKKVEKCIEEKQV
ncbi:MAG: hypothetical protein NC118_00060 [Eubacterium sp.]|nr:hypothetical protein [Eubacterium sp.]